MFSSKTVEEILITKAQKIMKTGNKKNCMRPIIAACILKSSLNMNFMIFKYFITLFMKDSPNFLSITRGSASQPQKCGIQALFLQGKLIKGTAGHNPSTIDYCDSIAHLLCDFKDMGTHENGTAGRKVT